MASQCPVRRGSYPHYFVTISRMSNLNRILSQLKEQRDSQTRRLRLLRALRTNEQEQSAQCQPRLVGALQPRKITMGEVEEG